MTMILLVILMRDYVLIRSTIYPFFCLILTKRLPCIIDEVVLTKPRALFYFVMKKIILLVIYSIIL